MEKKEVSIYFYYLQLGIINATQPVQDIGSMALKDFRNMLKYASGLSRAQRSYRLALAQKSIWMESCTPPDPCHTGNNEYNIVFGSAKYDQVRNVINTRTMEAVQGKVKAPEEGDEEKTHVCIRFTAANRPLVFVHESNFYGLTMPQIIQYLGELADRYAIATSLNHRLCFSYSIMSCDSFVQALERMKAVTIMQVTLDKEGLGGDWVRFAGRDETRDTVDLIFKRQSRKSNVSLDKDDIYEFYTKMRQTNESHIKRIRIAGLNESGPLRLDTQAMKEKQSIRVTLTPDTREVDSANFFWATDEVIHQMRERGQL